MNRDLMIKKIQTDILIIISIILVVLIAYFSISEEKVNLNWGVGIFSFIVLGIATKRFKFSGFQSNPNLGLTDCASLDDYENWFQLIIMIILIPLIPFELIFQSSVFIKSRN